MANIAVIPAKLDSVRIPRKNLQMIRGIPLVIYSVMSACQTNLFDRIIVSTESKEVEDTVRKYSSRLQLSNVVCFERKPENLGDAPISSVAVEVLEYLEEAYLLDLGGNVCLLSPTCPLRTVEDITIPYNRLISDPEIDFAVPVLKFHPHPNHAMFIDTNGYLRYNYTTPDIKNPMKFDGKLFRTLYRPISLGTWGKVSSVLKYGSMYDGIMVPYIPDPSHCIDIDTQEDLELARVLMEKRDNETRDNS